MSEKDGDAVCWPTLYTYVYVCMYVCMHVYSVSQTTMHLTFDHNFGKCRPIFKILSLPDSQGSFHCNCRTIFHLTITVMLHYVAKFKNFK